MSLLNLDLNNLLLESFVLRRQDKVIVTTNGCFDILHYGHLKLFKFCKTLGDILIVGINSDLSVKKIKGDNRPIINEKNRLKLIQELHEVDYAFLFNEETPINFLNIIKPDIHVNHYKYGYDCVEADTVIKNKGKIVLFKEDYDISTTKIVNNILEKNYD